MFTASISCTPLIATGLINVIRVKIIRSTLLITKKHRRFETKLAWGKNAHKFFSYFDLTSINCLFGKFRRVDLKFFTIITFIRPVAINGVPEIGAVNKCF